MKLRPILQHNLTIFIQNPAEILVVEIQELDQFVEIEDIWLFAADLFLEGVEEVFYQILIQYLLLVALHTL